MQSEKTISVVAGSPVISTSPIWNKGGQWRIAVA